MVSSGIKAVLIPPLVALALYLAAVYFLAPLYRRRQLYSQYLPLALASSDEPGFISRTRGRVQESFRLWAGERIWHRRGSSVDTNFNFGDEELEEDIPSDRFHNVPGREPEVPTRRLSRDLESGFLDDESDEEHEGRDSQRRVLGAR